MTPIGGCSPVIVVAIWLFYHSRVIVSHPAPHLFRGNFLSAKEEIHSKMAFPILHSMVGLAVYRSAKIQQRSWQKAFFFAFLATAADFDYLPGVLVGHPLLFHHTITHSLGATFACGLIAASITRLWSKQSFIKMFLLFSAAYFSHIAVDLFSPWPMPVFWPLQPVDLVKQIRTFQSLPLCGEGVKNFACDLLRHSSDIQRFGREIACLSAALVLFLFRMAARRFSVSFKQPAIATSDVTA
jgi:hypothetical protein